MKIVKLEAENIKRLRAVEITPAGNVVQITGRNGQGKTSLLDSIWWCLAGAAGVQAQPIRTGETRARIRLDLGELVVTRLFRRQDDGEITTELRVENAEGVRFGSPQRMLDALLGALSFDPLAFARMPAKEQFDTLRCFVPGVDFDALGAAQQADFDRRTALNRQAKEARAQAAGLHVPPDAPDLQTDEGALVAALAQASAHNSAIAKAEVELQAQGARALELQEQIRGLTAQLEELRTAIAVAPDPGTPIDVEDLRWRIQQAHAANEAYDLRVKHTDLVAEADQFERQSEDLTRAMHQREADKRAAIAAAAMPVPGLDFGDGVVLKDGVPFEQASDAEKLRASVAIAMAVNPQLRVIRIRDGSLLDSASLQLVAELAEAHDCQVWIERVADDRRVGFVIEDGSLVPGEHREAARV